MRNGEGHTQRISGLRNNPVPWRIQPRGLCAHARGGRGQIPSQARNGGQGTL